MEIKENVAQKNVKCSGKYIYYKKRFDKKFGLNLFLLKKRDMPGDDSDFFDNVIEWKKRCTMCVKGIEKTHTVCYIKTRNTYKVYKSWW